MARVDGQDPVRAAAHGCQAVKRLFSIITWPVRMVGAIALQPDKVAHFYWGASIGLCGLWMGWWGLTVVAIFAACKELYDLCHPPHNCDAWDFAATMVGGLCAIGVILWHAHHA